MSVSSSESGQVPPPLIEARDLWKAFPGVQALKSVDFDLRHGEVHVLVGENGAGKSTLVKIFSGVYNPDRGSVFLREEPVVQQTPRDALQAGIATVYQEFNLAPEMTVAQNVFLGQEPTRRGLVDRRALRRRTRQLMEQLDVQFDPDALVRDLGVAQQQIVEILKALAIERFSVLIMDEPTAALSRHEIDVLFGVIDRLRRRGVGVIYISHRLEEIARIGDRVTVFRDGEHVATRGVHEFTHEEIIERMIGRPVTQIFPERRSEPGEALLGVHGLTLKSGRARDVSFTLRRGEVLGLFGLIGAGRTEAVRGVFGLDAVDRGVVEVSGRRVTIRSPKRAVQLGLGLAPEDRKAEGILPFMSVADNINIASLDKVSVGPFTSRSKIQKVASRLAQTLRIAMPSTRTEIRFLSGGNQQKCILARLLAAESDILLLDEPTRGIDVGARAGIYELINELAAQGKAVLMISSDLVEIMGMSDLVVVFREGRIAASFKRALISEAAIMRAAVPERLEVEEGAASVPPA
jgi:ribose transport system ATP-binding protein